MSKLDQRLNDYYQSKTLSSARLQAILSQSQRSRSRRLYPVFAAAAMLVVVFAGTLHTKSLNDHRVTVALQEAAMNHATRLQLDAKAVTLPALQESLQELPFDLVLPKGGLYERLALVGGRYCTISGNLAAHLKFSDPGTNQDYSLFVTPSARNLKSLVSEPEQVSGVEVRLWQENDVVYALAKTRAAVP